MATTRFSDVSAMVLFAIESEPCFTSSSSSVKARLDIERSWNHRLELLLVRPGSLLGAQIRPHVLESPSGPVEVADLYLDDGSLIRAVPFACFAFVDADEDQDP